MRAASFPPQATDFIDFKNDGGVQIFYSTERFLIREIKKSAVAATQATGAEAALFDAAESGHTREAVGSSREIGFFGGRKVVILDYAEELLEKKQEKALKLVETAIAQPEPANLFIILFNDMDKRTKFYKELSKNKTLFHELFPPEKPELSAFIVAQFGPVKPDQKLVAHFIAKENSDLFYIESEVTKLRLWADSRGKKSITLAEADGILSSFGEEKIFRIMDILVKGDKMRAIELYRDLKVAEGEMKIHPVIITLLLKHFRIVLDGRVLQSKKRDADIPALIQSNNAFYLKYNFAEVFARYKNRTIVSALHDAAELELGMKGVYGVAMPDVSSSVEQFMLKYF
ncbi:MAG TPA: DNA polymerase III subunit delta [bacterium]|nr:DNA polymerase III subunit delta [bacterium]